jgi:hypothetical protein
MTPVLSTNQRKQLTEDYLWMIWDLRERALNDNFGERLSSTSKRTARRERVIAGRPYAAK